MKRLGLGTEESNRRSQDALEQLWQYVNQLFAPLPDEALLIEAGTEMQEVARLEPEATW